MNTSRVSAILTTGTLLAALSFPGLKPTEPVQSRHPWWPKTRAAHLVVQPECQACGQRDHVNVHHVVPFSDDPSRELDPENLITLCTDGPGHMNCHLLIGHAGNFQCANPNVRRDAKRFRAMLEGRKCD